MTTRAQPTTQAPRIVTLDVSGAPTRDRRWSSIFVNCFLGFLVGLVLFTPMNVLNFWLQLDRIDRWPLESGTATWCDRCFASWSIICLLGDDLPSASGRETGRTQAVRAEHLEHALLVHPLKGGKLAVISSNKMIGADYEAAIQTALYGMSCLNAN